MGALRRMPVDQQVALLFVVLFGVLMLASIAAAFWSMRAARDGKDEQARERIKRDLRAVWIGTSMFWVAWMSGAVGATLLFAFVSFLALREFITLQHTRRGDHRTLLLAFFFVLPMQYGIVAGGHFDLFNVFIPVYVFFAMPVVSALAGDPERFLERSAKIQWGVVVCVYGLSHCPALLLLDFKNYEDRGAFLVFFLVLVMSVAHLTHEFASRRFGSRVVAPDISLTFSFRAWWIACIVGGLVGALIYWVTPFKAAQAFVLGAAAAGVGTLGEFVMDALKRDAGVKQWGNQRAVTGAVGLLDRVAPLCFAAPVFFHGVRWYFNAGA
jgi:phosphatidate cytidylyltransferase